MGDGGGQKATLHHLASDTGAEVNYGAYDLGELLEIGAKLAEISSPAPKGDSYRKLPIIACLDRLARR